ncbi:unnamed protein product, partial [Pylaiella littoralis]
LRFKLQARPIDRATQEEGQHRRSYPHLPSAVHASWSGLRIAASQHKEKTEEEEEEEKGEGEARGSKRRKIRKDETTAAEESKRESMKRVARHMHQID